MRKSVEDPNSPTPSNLKKFGDEADRFAQVRSEAGGEADDDEPSEEWSELQEGVQWGAYLNIEGPRTIRVIRPPATTGIALVLRDCATLDCATPSDLRLLLDRLESKGRCPNLDLMRHLHKEREVRSRGASPARSVSYRPVNRTDEGEEALLGNGRRRPLTQRSI